MHKTKRLTLVDSVNIFIEPLKNSTKHVKYVDGSVTTMTKYRR